METEQTEAAEETNENTWTHIKTQGNIGQQMKHMKTQGNMGNIRNKRKQRTHMKTVDRNGNIRKQRNTNENTRNT